PERQDTWRPDLAAVTIETSTWPKTWAATFRVNDEAYALKPGGDVLLTGGGCTELTGCRPQSSYAIYADVFSIADVYAERFTILPPSPTSSVTHFGDSGGPVVVGGHFLGVISAKRDSVTMIQKLVWR